jgi:hypothetical protein
MKAPTLTRMSRNEVSADQAMPRSTLLTLQLATILGVLPSLWIAFVLYWPGPNMMSAVGLYLGQDFVNFWAAGYLALTGRAAEIYDFGAYMAAVKTLFVSSMRPVNFSYPPHALLFTWPLALLPYGVALVMWEICGLAAFVAVSLAGVSRTEAVRMLPVLVFSPIAILVLGLAQASFLVAALFVGALRVLPRRPIVAGMLLGVLTVKPQLGLLLPPALLLVGERRAFISAAATALGLVVLSVIVFGLEPWRDYAANTLRFQQLVVNEMPGLVSAMMVTPYAAFWWLGMPSGAALILHAAVAGWIAAGALWIVRSDAEPPLKIATLAVAAVAFTPYCLNYDLAIPAAGLMVWAMRQREPALSTLLAVGLFWLMPCMGMALAASGIPILPIPVLLLFAALAHEAWRGVTRASQLPLPAREVRTDIV